MIDRLIDAIIEKRNPTVMGLDPCLEYLPDSEYKLEDEASFEEAAEKILDFNKRLIDAVCDIVPAVKLQLAYYEMYSIPGIKCLHETADYAAGRGLIVIGDGKRNDIGTTASAYSNAYLGRTRLAKIETDRAFKFDFLTVNPYLGSDGIKPFLNDMMRYDRGIFVLVKTSNPSSGELQDLKIEDGRLIYEAVGDSVLGWGLDSIGRYGYSDVGAVVGATYPRQCEALRQRLGTVFFLIPGYGAQGAGASELAGGFDENGLGAIVNASRSLMCAYKKHGMPFDEAARKEALYMQQDLLKGLSDAKKLNY